MWKLRALQLGNDAARSLGMSLEAVQGGLIVTGCAFGGVGRRDRRADRLSWR
jgi:ABC-type Fe3+-siderophore transport system permease subunit